MARPSRERELALGGNFDRRDRCCGGNSDECSDESLPSSPAFVEPLPIFSEKSEIEKKKKK